MEPLLEVTGLSFGYARSTTLEAIDLHLHPGQFAALVGPSGAGKTTLLRLVLGMLPPSRGRVTLRRQGPDRRPPTISYVPQLETVDWNFPVTAEQVVLMGRVRRTHRWPWPSREDRQRAETVFERLDLAQLRQRPIRDLSGGQQQRVFLARALLAEPDLLVLDEPMTGVDAQTAERMLHLLAELNRQGMTILMTTHDLNAAASHVPWLVCLNRRIVAQGSPETVLTPATLNATYGGDMVVVRHAGLLFVQQRPHGHSYHDCIPHPVPGEVPDPTREASDGAAAGTVPL